MKKLNFYLLMLILIVTQNSFVRSATVFDVIAGSSDHETLEAAIIAAGLDDDLSGPGPFTVFAPTDDAFDALPEGILDALLADPTGNLTDILLYHVLSGSVTSGDLSDGMIAKTLLGKNIEVTIDGHSNVYINNALVTGADIHTDNGVVHVINAVLVPSNTVVDIIESSEDHTTLATAIDLAGLRMTLKGDGPFTVFAPTDDAFDALPEGVLDALLADPTGALANVLLYHVVGDSVVSGDLSDGQLVATLLGNKVMVTIDGGVYINDAMVTIADIEADNGVVHVVNAVLVPTNSVVDVIETSDDHMTLATAIDLAGLRMTLMGDGPFTVFAPTDDAFEALPEGVLDALLADPTGALADVLLYHVVGDSVVSGDLSDGQLVATLLGNKVKVTIDGGVYINDARVTVADIEADNGVVHVVNAVLVPTNSVVDVIETSEDHMTLATAIDLAGLRMTLMGDGPFTVFAPTDDAFEALPEGVLDALLADPTGALADVLLYHVVGDSVVSGDLSDGQLIATLLGNKVEVTIDGGVFINDAQVTVADLEADNGVVHVLNAVLVPSNTVVDVIETSEDHMTLATAIDLADLRMTLMGEGPFTVFAPTDDAFSALPEGLLNDLLADPSGALTEILLYHVVGDSVVSGDLSDGQIVQTLLERKDVEVTINAEGVFINDAKVIFADLIASNGVVHVIDAVLVQDTVTVVDIIVGSEDHTILETAVIAAELADDLSGEGPFTVFAPTDDAFAALPDGVLDELLADPTGALADVLLYHVVSGNVMSGDLSDGMVVTTLLGKDINVTINSEGVFINEAQVIVADLEADNGVVHVLDAVLIPPVVTVVDIIINSPDHETLETAVIAAELADDLSGEGPFTVFAPTDDAFAALPDGLLDELLADPTGTLADILLYHVASGSVMSGDLSDGQMIPTLYGQDVRVTIDGNVYINDAMVTVADLEADNGVVHVIDAVLVPVATALGSNASESIQFSVYPNPASEYVNLNLVDLDDAQVSVINSSGAVVDSFRVTGSETRIDISAYSQGIYHMLVSSGNSIESKKFIVR